MNKNETLIQNTAKNISDFPGIEDIAPALGEPAFMLVEDPTNQVIIDKFVEEACWHVANAERFPNHDIHAALVEIAA